MAPAPQNIGAAVPGEYLGDLQVHLAVDLGAQPHATGTVTTDANGTPISYTVAADDENGEGYAFVDRLPNPHPLQKVN